MTGQLVQEGPAEAATALAARVSARCQATAANPPRAKSWSTWPLRIVCWLLRRSGPFPGRWRLERWRNARAAVIKRLPPAVISLGRGCRMHIDPADYEGRLAYLYGHEARDPIVRVLRQYLRSGDWVLDIGANAGRYALLAARLVGPAGRVHAFEASPPTFARLQRNLALNAAARVDAHAVAVLDRCGQTAFSVATGEQTGLSSVRDLGPRAAARVTVPTVSVDCRLEEWPQVRLAKIDVEGAELRVLEGMRELLARDRPVLVVELSDTALREAGADGEQVFAFLLAAGYRLFRLRRRGPPVALAGAPTDHCDVLALPTAASQGAP